MLSTAHYEYEGSARSAARAAWFTFVTKRKETFADLPPFVIVVDGQTIYEGEAELSLNIYEINGGRYYDQWIRLRVPAEVLLRVAGAKAVEFRVGGRAYKPEPFQQKYLGALAKIVAP